MTKPVYPAPPDHQAQYVITDGRHRWCGVVERGDPKTLPCLVNGADRNPEYRVIPVNRLMVDPDVQFAWALSPKLIVSIATRFDPRRLGVLTVFPLGDSTPSERAQVKLGIDYHRRKVKHTESFLIKVIGKDPTAVAIKRTAENAGWKIGNRRGQAPYDAIEATKMLENIEHALGLEGLARTLELAAIWLGDRDSNNNRWLESLSLLVSGGYDRSLTTAQQTALADIVPAQELRRAKGAVAGMGSKGYGYGYSAIAVACADNIRKTCRLRKPRDT